MGKVNSGDDGLECEVVGRLGEVVVVVRWPAEPMQQEVKGFIGPQSAGEGRKRTLDGDGANPQVSISDSITSLSDGK